MVLRYTLGGAAPYQPISISTISSFSSSFSFNLDPPASSGATTGAIQVAPSVTLPIGQTLYLLQDGAVLDSCVLGRGPRSIAFPKEYSKLSAMIDGSAVDPMVLGATCEFTPFSNQKGSSVVGFVRIVLLPDLTVRLSYSITGLPPGGHVMTFAEVGPSFSFLHS